ncbi:hypothetical protein [Lacisediminihabitans sp. H27-G8]|uniref:hypothetical protein n=1 Tax=Lacisediminihabitans sp. H27-G8 TaxID=3111909 RepID=UPI0038FD1B0A
MSGSIEELTFADRVERLRQMANALIAVIKGGTVSVMDALRAASDLLGVTLSQMKYGLSYARTNGLVFVNENTAELRLAA